MGQGKLLRELNRKTLELPHATRALRQLGKLEPDQVFALTIRKVKLGEVTALVDTPPRLLALNRERGEDMTDDDWNQRVQELLEGDENLMRVTTKYNTDLQRAIVQLGVTSQTIVLSADEMTEDGDEILPEDLGDDFEIVYNAILEWSMLPYARLSATFLEDEVADAPEPDGEVLQEAPA